MAQHRSHLRSPSRRDMPAASFEIDLSGRERRRSGAHRAKPGRGRRITFGMVAAAALGPLAEVGQLDGTRQ